MEATLAEMMEMTGFDRPVSLIYRRSYNCIVKRSLHTVPQKIHILLKPDWRYFPKGSWSRRRLAQYWATGAPKNGYITENHSERRSARYTSFRGQSLLDYWPGCKNEPPEPGYW